MMPKKNGGVQGQPVSDKNAGFDDEANQVRIAKGIWIHDADSQQNQLDGDVLVQDGDDPRTTAQHN